MTGEGVWISLEYGLSNLNNKIAVKLRSVDITKADLIKGEWMDVLGVIIFGHFKPRVSLHDLSLN